MTEDDFKQYNPFENIDSAIQSYSEKIKDNFSLLNQVQTGFHEVDIKRFETKQCVVFGLGISAIVMATVTLEETLKTLLKYHHFYGNFEKKEELVLEEWGKASNEAEDTYGTFKLHNAIQKARKEGLITEDEEKVLIEIKDKIRNVFIHSDKTKMFDRGANFRVDAFKIEEGKILNAGNAMMNMSGFNIGQGIAEKEIADRECIEIVRQIDKIISEICDRFWKSHSKK